MASTILITKLFIPATRPDLVGRPKLVERLVAGLDHGDRFSRKLSLISAPAGFGKTVLVSHWLTAMEGSPGSAGIAWLSLEGGDNDLIRFLEYLLAALNRMDTRGDRFGKGVLGMLQSPQPPDPSMVLTPLINEITAYPEKLIFILDVFHEADGKKASSLLHKPNQQDLVFIKDLLESGKIQPVIDRQYPLSEVPEAVGYLDSSNHRGKVAITVSG